MGKPPFETACLKETYNRIKKNNYTIPWVTNGNLSFATGSTSASHGGILAFRAWPLCVHVDTLKRSQSLNGNIKRVLPTPVVFDGQLVNAPLRRRIDHFGHIFGGLGRT